MDKRRVYKPKPFAHAIEIKQGKKENNQPNQKLIPKNKKY
jgi:hypothetical protein